MTVQNIMAYARSPQCAFKRRPRSAAAGISGIAPARIMYDVSVSRAPLANTSDFVRSPANETTDAAPTRCKRSSRRARRARPFNGPEVPEKPEVAPDISASVALEAEAKRETPNDSPR